MAVGRHPHQRCHRGTAPHLAVPDQHRAAAAHSAHPTRTVRQAERAATGGCPAAATPPSPRRSQQFFQAAIHPASLFPAPTGTTVAGRRRTPQRIFYHPLCRGICCPGNPVYFARWFRAAHQVFYPQREPFFELRRRSFPFFNRKRRRLVAAPGF